MAATAAVTGGDPECSAGVDDTPPRKKQSRSFTAHISGPVPPRRPMGLTRPSILALSSAPGVLKPQYVAASRVVRAEGVKARAPPSIRKRQSQLS